ncbi:MAG: efflux transporter outer membrane subunit [Chitinophagaceae bacterium]|nr:MAG: efflux transporter outer membrane subunit [Chitinophagaceae bacterium]
MTRVIILVLITATALGSCKVNKPYQQPEVATPQQFRGATADTLSIADKQWKELYSDTKLSALIDSGIKNNYDLLIAVNRLDISRKRMRQAKLLQLPELNFSVAGQYSRPSDNSLNGISIKNFLKSNHVENYQALASLTWEADIWGKIRNQKEAALAEYMQSYEAVKAVQTQIVADIAHGYFNLLMLDKQLEISRNNLSLSDSFLLATQKLKDAGLVNLLAVQQAESQKQATSILIPQLQENIGIQENALKILTGALPDSVERIGVLKQMLRIDNISAGVPAALLSRRPDVRSAELSIVAANARLGVAKASMYPALNITAGGGLESFKASNWFNIPGSLFGLAAGTIAQPIFKRNQLKTNYEVAKLEREQAVLVFRQQVLLAVGEVSDALVQLEKLREQEVIAQAQVDTLKQAVSNSRKLFSSDLANYLEVLTAQGNALQAELSLASIQKGQLDAMIELYRALGGGWK